MIVGEQDSGATCVLFQDDLRFCGVLASSVDKRILRPCRRKRERDPNQYFRSFRALSAEAQRAFASRPDDDPP